MTLRFKRNIPLVITLIIILTVLVVMIGNQPIVSYAVNPEAIHTASLTSISNTLGQLTNAFTFVQP
jgi:hypothetical protein